MLPLIEVSLRATASSRLPISPHEILFGRQMKVFEFGLVPPKLPFAGDQLAYFRWLTDELKVLHAGVKQDKIDIKEREKAVYDKRHNPVSIRWKVGDRVLLYDKRIQPHGESVVTHRPFAKGPYFISEVVAGRPDIGPACKLIHVQSGKSLRGLISVDRLKAYAVDSTDLELRLPRRVLRPVNDQSRLTDHSDVQPINTGTQVVPADSSVDTSMSPAVRILRERVRAKQKEYLVYFLIRLSGGVMT